MAMAMAMAMAQGDQESAQSCCGATRGTFLSRCMGSGDAVDPGKTITS